jgi:hypothetical protein
MCCQNWNQSLNTQLVYPAELIAHCVCCVSPTYWAHRNLLYWLLSKRIEKNTCFFLCIPQIYMQVRVCVCVFKSIKLQQTVSYLLIYFGNNSISVSKSFFFFSFFSFSPGNWTQGLALTRPVLFHWAKSPIPLKGFLFCFVLFLALSPS